MNSPTAGSGCRELEIQAYGSFWLNILEVKVVRVVRIGALHNSNPKMNDHDRPLHADGHCDDNAMSAFEQIPIMLGLRQRSALRISAEKVISQ
jgi:hypothetical protein